MTLTEFQRELCTSGRWDCSGLRALYVNCTLKPSPELSHTEGLIRISMAIMEAKRVEVDYVRAADDELAPGVRPAGSARRGRRLSYLDPDSGGPENDFTNRNTTFMTWNLLHVARMVKDAGGLPAHSNQRSLWDAGCRFDFANPDYR